MGCGMCTLTKLFRFVLTDRVRRISSNMCVGSVSCTVMCARGAMPAGHRDDARRLGGGLFSEGYNCGCRSVVCEFWMSFHRSANVF